jgi:hypothetical protein
MIVLAFAAPVSGQQRPIPSSDSSVLSGRVVDAGVPVAGAEITLVTLAVATRSDTGGRFRFEFLPAGEHLVEVRQPGREMKRETVTLRARHETVVEFVVGRTVAQLDTVRSTATQTPAFLRDFESRRTKAVAGRFLTDSVLRANEHATMTSLLRSHVPGLRIVNYRGLEFAASGRGGDGFAVNPDDVRSPRACLPQIYIDGQLMYDAPPGMPPPLSTFAVFNFAAIEYYAGAAATPLEFRSFKNQCGVLILWRRQKEAPR